MRSIISTALTETLILDSMTLLDAMESGAADEQLDLADLMREKVTLYVVLPLERLETHGRWMRMIIALALKAANTIKQRSQLPTLYILDELGTISPGAGLPAIAQAYGLMGGANIRVWGFFQDLTQLKADYPQKWESMIGNSQSIQILGVNENTTADYFSARLGTQTLWDGEKPYQQPAFSPQQMRALDGNDVLMIFAGGAGAYLLQAPHYFAEPRWTGKYRRDPSYPISESTQSWPALATSFGVDDLRIGSELDSWLHPQIPECTGYRSRNLEPWDARSVFVWRGFRVVDTSACLVANSADSYTGESWPWVFPADPRDGLELEQAVPFIFKDGDGVPWYCQDWRPQRGARVTARLDVQFGTDAINFESLRPAMAPMYRLEVVSRGVFLRRAWLTAHPLAIEVLGLGFVPSGYSGLAYLGFSLPLSTALPGNRLSFLFKDGRQLGVLDDDRSFSPAQAETFLPVADRRGSGGSLVLPGGSVFEPVGLRTRGPR